VPDATPLTIPDEVPTVAFAVLLLLHTPPLISSLNAVVKPTQTVLVPDRDGAALTVTTTPLAQPVDVIV
jgi:hypothetical protein